MIDQNVVDYIYYDKLNVHTVILKVTNWRRIKGCVTTKLIK